MPRVLICGGRTYGYIPAYPEPGHVEEWRAAVQRGQRQRDALNHRLDRLVSRYGPENLTIIHGAASGADELAGAWAHDSGIDVIAFPITDEEWARWGRAAGPKRNARMLLQGEPDLVIAFEGGKGAQNMVRLARGAGVTVDIVEADQCAVLT